MGCFCSKRARDDDEPSYKPQGANEKNRSDEPLPSLTPQPQIQCESRQIQITSSLIENTNSTKPCNSNNQPTSVSPGVIIPDRLNVHNYNRRLTLPTNDACVPRQKQSSKKVTVDKRKYNLLNLKNSSATVPYTIKSLEFWDPEYKLIDSLVRNKKKVKVTSIEKIENPFLAASYDLKKEQKLRTFNLIEERLMFHGTKSENIDSICKFNFDWRLTGANVGHRFGEGISFSHNATYASNYSGKGESEKVLIVAKVLIGRSCPGNKLMKLPPEGFDTTQKGDGIVTVKYEDSEFLPVYKITYILNNFNNYY